ncbi:MAG: polysaccharide biosynthesis protein [Rhizobacter sp.]|nr:polysaccharide biosynthesis protein [Rhizobacter sp.]
MLGRQVLGFLPAHVVPAVTSFVGVYVFTRFATPAEYGLFALAMSVAQMCQSVLFSWVQVGATRHIESSRRNGTLHELQAAVYRSHAATFVLFAVGYAVVLLLLPLEPRVRNALWWVLLIVGLRSLVAVNQAFHRGDLKTARFNVIECTQALVQLGLGLALLVMTTAGAGALLASAAVAASLVLMIDVPAVSDALRRSASRAEVMALLRFGLPLSTAFALNYVLATSDRLLVEYYLGSSAVGVYSVAYGLMDRSVSSLFVAISLAAYPLAVHAYEREGAAAASRQLRSNGKLMLAVTLPICALMICLNKQLAAVMVGEAFRGEAQAIMPWIALAALLAGFQMHFFDHAFHLSRRTSLFVWTTGPAALVNIAANVVLLPRLGLMGAVWATLAGYAVSLATSVIVGARVFKVPLDLPELARVVVACAVMSAAVLATRLPSSVLGLFEGCLVAFASYGAMAFVLDIGNARSRVQASWTRWTAS